MCGSVSRLEDGMIRPTRAEATANWSSIVRNSSCDVSDGAQPALFEPRQHLLRKVRQLIKKIHKMEEEPVEPNAVQAGQLLGDVVWIADRTVGAARQNLPFG